MQPQLRLAARDEVRHGRVAGVGGRYLEVDGAVRVAAAHERRVGQVERLHAAADAQLQAAVEQLDAVLCVQGVAVGVDGDGGDIAGGRREELLALEFVPGAEEVGRSERRIEAGLHHIGPAVEKAAVLVEWLVPDAEWAVDMLPLGSHGLIGDAVGGAGGDGVLQYRAAVEER